VHGIARAPSQRCCCCPEANTLLSGCCCCCCCWHVCRLRQLHMVSVCHPPGITVSTYDTKSKELLLLLLLSLGLNMESCRYTCREHAAHKQYMAVNSAEPHKTQGIHATAHPMALELHAPMQICCGDKTNQCLSCQKNSATQCLLRAALCHL
jgi:hypothetical protein